MLISKLLMLASGLQVSQQWVEVTRQSLQKTSPSFGWERKMPRGEGRFILFPVSPQIFLTCVNYQQGYEPCKWSGLHTLWPWAAATPSLKSYTNNTWVFAHLETMPAFFKLSFHCLGEIIYQSVGWIIGKMLECHMPRKILGRTWS